MSLLRSTLRSLSIFWLAQILAVGLTQIGMLILARYLSPDDFGLYSIVVVVFNLTFIVSTVGIEYAAIQSKDPEERVLSTGWAVRISSTAVTVACLILIAPIISSFFGDSRLSGPVRLASIAIVALLLAFVPTVVLNKNLKFKELSISRVAYALTWPAVALAAAAMGMSYWSLVLALVSANITSLVVLHYFARRKVVFAIDRPIARKLLSFGRYSAAAGFLSFVFFNLDKIVVGKMLGGALLGAYFLAFSWGTIVPTIFTNVASAVMFPTYSNISDNLKTLRNAFEKTVTYLSYISFPLGMGLAGIANTFVLSVLGTKWSAASFPLAILSLVGVSISMTSPASSLFLATGRPYLSWRQTVGMLIPYGLLIVPVTHATGLNGVSLLLLAVTTGGTVWVLLMGSRILQMPLIELAKPLSRPLLASSLMGATVFISSLLIPPSLLSLTALVAGGFALYLGLMIALTGGRVVAEFRTLIGAISK